MPVIINDFEITVDAPAARTGADVSAPKPPSPPPSPEQILAIAEWGRARAERVRAT